MVALGWVWHSRLAYLREAERRAADEERLRIARELHDVVGHHLSLINVQAGTSLHRFHRDPAQGEAALAAIKESSRDALRDPRATLGILRQAGEEAPTAPAPPGLDGIGELIGSARSAGLTVHSRVARAADPPTEVGLAAYRIVQESLTNVSRHAPAAEVTVSVEDGPGELRIEVADDGPGQGAGVPGSGVRGMRQRASALGGELTAGPGPDGGFLVRARLPYEAAPPMIKVLLADDQGLVRAGFRSILDDEDDITVTGEAADGEQAVAACRELRPDVALLDVRMPRMDGLEAARRITADPRLDDVRVVILTTFDLDEYVYGALRAGATGFLLKDTERSGADPGGAGRGARRRADHPVRHPAPHRRVRRTRRDPRPRPRLKASPSGSARSCCSSPPGRATTRSPPGSC